MYLSKLSNHVSIQLNSFYLISSQKEYNLKIYVSIECHFQYVIQMIVLQMIIKRDGGQIGTKISTTMVVCQNLEIVYCLLYIGYHSLIAINYGLISFLFTIRIVIFQTYLFEPCSDIVKMKQHIAKGIWEVLILFCFTLFILPPKLSFSHDFQHITKKASFKPVISYVILIHQVGFQFKIDFGKLVIFVGTIKQIKKQTKATKINVFVILLGFNKKIHDKFQMLWWNLFINLNCL